MQSLSHMVLGGLPREVGEPGAQPRVGYSAGGAAGRLHSLLRLPESMLRPRLWATSPVGLTKGPPGAAHAPPAGSPLAASSQGGLPGAGAEAGARRPERPEAAGMSSGP